MLMELEIQEIHTKREDKTHITTIRIFSYRLQRLLHMYSIQLQKITFKSKQLNCSLALCQKVIHLEILIFIQVEFLWFETDYNDKSETFWFHPL